MTAVGTSTARVATAADEVPVWIPVGDEALFAILTRPTVEPNGVTVVVSSSGHWVTTIGSNRTYVRLARSLAAAGYHTLRMDYLGIGESSGPSRRYRLDQPFAGDAAAALDWLRGQGLHRFVLLGNCYGARVAMAAAQAAPPGDVVGVALFPPVVRDFEHGQRAASLPVRELVRRAFTRGALRNLRSAEKRRRYRAALAKKVRTAAARRRAGRDGGGDRGGRQQGAFEWVSPHFVRPLAGLVEANVPVLLVFGKDEDFYLDFQRGRPGRLDEILERAGDLVTLDVIEGNAHGLGTIAVQDEVVDAITRWLPGR